MKKYNTLFVVVITILLTALLTWILPITYLNGELLEAPRFQAGITNLFSYSVYTFYNFIYVFVYLLGVGGLYGLLNKTGAYRLLLEKIVKRVEKHQVLWLIVTVLFLSIVTSLNAFTFEAMIILPFIAGIVLMLGYDKITAALITVGSVATGIIGNTFSNLVQGNFMELIDSLKFTDLIIVKVILLVVCAAILIVNIILHAKKVEKTKNVSESFIVPEKVKGKVKVWPLVTILCIFGLVLLLATINWTNAFEIDFFTTLLGNINSGKVLSKYVVLVVSLLVVIGNVLYSIIKNKKEKNKKLMNKKRLIVTICFGVFALLALLKVMLEDVFNATDIMTKAIEAIKLNEVIDNFTFSKLLGNVNAFGEWGYPDYLVWMMILILTIKFTYRIKMDEVLENVGNGFKNVLYATLVALLAYTVLMLTASHPVVLTALRPLLELTDGLSVLWYPIATFINALFNTDFTYYSRHILTLDYAKNYFTVTSVYPLCALITQCMYGLAIMIAPTSATLLFSLAFLDIKYTTWLKKVWLLFLEFVLVVFVAFIIVSKFLI